MEIDEITKRAIEIGENQAGEILQLRARALENRSKALKKYQRSLRRVDRSIDTPRGLIDEQGIAKTKGFLVAEGDSWFDYPFHDVLKQLEDDFGYDVESFAHHGDTLEEMAYGGNQLEEITRKIEKILRFGTIPKAVLLSGGGNDVAGPEFGLLLNHAQSGIAGLNKSVLDGVINQRVRLAYIHVLIAITKVCKDSIGKNIPILLHGYDYPVPDGRGFVGGWGVLPGPWLEPGFRQKGYSDINQRVMLAHELIENFNVMIESICKLAPFAHVHYVDLRNTLQTGPKYKRWWANELHPTKLGFQMVAKRFASTLDNLL